MIVLLWIEKILKVFNPSVADRFLAGERQTLLIIARSKPWFVAFFLHVNGPGFFRLVEVLQFLQLLVSKITLLHPQQLSNILSYSGKSIVRNCLCRLCITLHGCFSGI